jgi:hypothetical protein
MTSRSKAILSAICFVGIFVGRLACALNEDTHELVNEAAIPRERLDRALRGLGLRQGIDEPFQGFTATRWMRQGGRMEDDGSILLGTARYLRHFHDPLQPWDSAGLKWPILGQHESSVRWMQRPGTQPKRCLAGDWSWQEARRYYLDALTCEDPDQRDQAWANLFRALGQVMHLVVDASVPEHTRNDPHPLGRLFGSYEYWLERQQGLPGSDVERAFIRQYLSGPIHPDPGLLQQPTGDPLAPVPVARLIDADVYTGADPNLTLAAAVGLAEVANANFFSEDTGRSRLLLPDYPFPSLERLQPSRHPAPLTGRVRAYYTKGAGDGLAVDPVLAECVLDEAFDQAGVAGRTRTCTDERVWTETARAMLPRAVGYARAVLDYFFRGRLGATLQVAKANGTLHATLEVGNDGDEEMQGTLTLHYDRPSGHRASLGPWPVSLVPGQRSDPIVLSALPPDVPPTAWTLVFRGRLGLESDAVAATRVGGQYVGVLQYYAFSADSYHFSSDRGVVTSSPAEEIFLGGGSAVTNYGGPVEELKTVQFLYRDPTLPARTVDITPGGMFCAADEIVQYGVYYYRQFNSYRVLWLTPVSVTVTRLVPPDTLAALFDYTYLHPPAPREPLVPTLEPTSAPVTVDPPQADFVWVRPSTEATDPGPPAVAYPEGGPFAQRRAFCGGVARLRVLE